jgi:hypothetical protein
MNPVIEQELAGLVFLSLENEITPQHQKRLEEILGSDPAAVRYYFLLINVSQGVKDPHNLQVLHAADQPLPYDLQLWNALAEEEKTAPTREMPKEVFSLEMNQKIVLEKPVRKISRFNIVSLAVSFAALFLAIAYVRLIPSSPNIEIATLMESVNANWEDSTLSLRKGDQLYSNKSLVLSKGIIEVQTLRGVRMTIEGPAEFEFTKEADCYLKNGRIYANVSSQGIGFTVSTTNAKVIDLGTEFGVRAEKGGETELHVIKGKTTMVSGGSWLNKQIQSVLQGQARKISIDGLKVDDIPVLQKEFARGIDTQTKTVWRGERINLADIAGGGNGSGTGTLGAAIDPATGGLVAVSRREGRSFDERYVRALSNPLIDGVFVPNGKDGPVQISSTQITFGGFRETCGRFWQELSNGGKQLFGSMAEPDYITLQGVPYGDQERPALFMHSNLGITYDLQQVRRLVPGCRASEFTALCGIPEHSGSGYYSLVDFLVLVDGRCVFRRDQVRHDSQPIPVKVEIGPQDRFLTLVVTDGGNGHYEDAAVYALPYLELTNE